MWKLLGRNKGNKNKDTNTVMASTDKGAEALSLETATFSTG